MTHQARDLILAVICYGYIAGLLAATVCRMFGWIKMPKLTLTALWIPPAMIVGFLVLCILALGGMH